MIKIGIIKYIKKAFSPFLIKKIKIYIKKLFYILI
jgi:hypothetical protein